jgi:hypothetical protein
MVKYPKGWYNKSNRNTWTKKPRGFSRENDERMVSVMNMAKIEELLNALKKKEEEEEKQKNIVLWVLAIIGAVAAVAGIAFAVYHFFAPDYLEDFDEDYDDDFDDYFEDDEEK